MIISLTGFMGCGKSSVGRKLSELLCCNYVDLDSVIETREGRSIPEIFTADGEAAFRSMELDALKSVISENPQTIVLSLGGGTIMTPECARLVHNHTHCNYLRADIDTLVNNLKDEADGRPMLQGDAQPHTSDQEKINHLRSRIETLMEQRSTIYENTAHIIIDTDGKSIDSISEEVLSKL